MRFSRHSPLALARKASATPHYQTFPNTRPPTSKGRPPSHSPPPPSYHSRHPSGDSHHGSHEETPLPKKQLLVLAIIALSEQTAFNSISPYLPQMAASFAGVGPDEAGLYVGIIASAFAAAQFATCFLWGWLSDRIGRKPVILLGTLLSAACFFAFGFCRELWQAILVQALLGLVNGNQGVVSTILGEITDRSNQSRAFTYLPVIFGLGAITGPAVGGLLQGVGFDDYPYLAPNLFSSAVLLVDLVCIMLLLEESLEDARSLPPLGKRVGSLFAWAWQFASSSRPSYLKVFKHRHNFGADGIHAEYHGSDEDEEDSDEDEDDARANIPRVFPVHTTDISPKYIFSRDTLLLLASYTIFQLSNVAYNSLYPIFAEASPPTGRALSPRVVGLSLSFAGLVTIVFQVGIFGKLREKMGNKWTYRTGLAGFVLVFLMMPWVGYKDVDDGDGGISDGTGWLLAELGFVLLLKTIATVGGLTSALLLITNSAPDHAVLGTLNGLAQTLSAAGRAVGPFVSGGLFTLATHVRPKGEALAFGLFGGVSFVGLLLSFGIHGRTLEADGLEEEEEGGGGGRGGDGEGGEDEEEEEEEEEVGGEDEEEEDDDADHGDGEEGGPGERTGLLRR